MAERAAKSFGSCQGAALNQLGWKSTKSAVYQKPDQSAMERCEAAALKRWSWVTIQLVSTPPPLPPVTASLLGSAQPFFTISSTPRSRSVASSPG